MGILRFSFYTNWIFFKKYLNFNFNGLIVINAAQFSTKSKLCNFVVVKFDPFCNVRCPSSECPLWVLPSILFEVWKAMNQ